MATVVLSLCITNIALLYWTFLRQPGRKPFVVTTTNGRLLRISGDGVRVDGVAEKVTVFRKDGEDYVFWLDEVVFVFDPNTERLLSVAWDKEGRQMVRFEAFGNRVWDVYECGKKVS